METEDLVGLLTLAFAVFAFAVGLWQYHIAQRWKRAEWVAAEMRLFLDDPTVHTACLMIDWGLREVQLPPSGGAEVPVTDDEIRDALVHHRHRPNGFKKKEAQIRDVFDRFLDGLERCQAYVRSGLVEPADFVPYLSYWAHHIVAAREGDKSVDRLVQLKTYASDYGYYGALELMQALARLHPAVTSKEKV